MQLECPCPWRRSGSEHTFVSSSVPVAAVAASQQSCLVCTDPAAKGPGALPLECTLQSPVRLLGPTSPTSVRLNTHLFSCPSRRLFARVWDSSWVHAFLESE